MTNKEKSYICELTLGAATDTYDSSGVITSKGDTSNITNMFDIFHCNSSRNWKLQKFNGDISNWDVSNVGNMGWMFYNSEFNGDISKWDVSNVKDMTRMFQYSNFNLLGPSW